MSGGGGGTNTVTRTELDPTMKPFVQYGLTEAQRLYASPDVLQYYPGQTYVGPSAQTQAAMTAAQQRAAMGSPLTPAAQQTALQTIQGGFLGGNRYTQALEPTISGQMLNANPYIQNLQPTISGQMLTANPYLQQALQPGFEASQRQYEGSVNQALSNFSRAGRYGSNAMQGALGQASGEYARALTGAAGQLGYQNYADERARQMAAIGAGAQSYATERANQLAAIGAGQGTLEAERARQQAMIGAAPQLAQADYADIQQMANLGAQAEAYQEMALADAVNRFNFQQQMPYTRLQSFLSAAYGAPSGMQQITPVYRNQFGSALGGGLAGYALGGGPGAAIGAGLGLLG